MKRYGIMSVALMLAIALSASWASAEPSKRGRRGHDVDKKDHTDKKDQDRKEHGAKKDHDKKDHHAKAPQRPAGPPQRGFHGRGPHGGSQGRFSGRGPSEEMKRRFEEMRKKAATSSKDAPKSREEFIKRMRERMAQHHSSASAKKAPSKPSPHSSKASIAPAAVTRPRIHRPTAAARPDFAAMPACT